MANKRVIPFINDTIIFYTMLVVLFMSLFYHYNVLRVEGFQEKSINKTIWLLWLQGWDSAPWLPQQVKKSWQIKNPGWKVKLVTLKNLKQYVTDIDYVYRDTISPQAKSDIIRLALLNKHGGVWADATLLCMQPLDTWVLESIQQSGLWMYHGSGGYMDIKHGPASWFIVSISESRMIRKWKQASDAYWKDRESTEEYFWMDMLFKNLYENDIEFKKDWDSVPYLSCEDKGQSHMFAEGSWKDDTPEIKKLLDESPPRVLKLWNPRWMKEFPDITDERCTRSNGYHAIQLALRQNTI